MSNSSTILNDEILDAYLLTFNTEISLWETDPLDDGSGTEESGTGYARFAMTPADWEATLYDLNGGRATNNTVVIDFGLVGAGGWSSTVGWAGVHRASDGDLLFHKEFTGGAVDLSVAGTPFTIPAGLFIVQMGGA